MAKKNESLVGKAIRYGGAFLGGGVFGIGKEALDDYEEHLGEALADAVFSPINEAWENEEYEQVIELADQALSEDDMDEEILRAVTWIKARAYYHYAIQNAIPYVDFQDERNQHTLDAFEKSVDCFYDYGNQYGWDHEVVYWIMKINHILERWDLARNCAIYVMGSDDRDLRSAALDTYEDITNTLFNSDWQFTKDVPYSERKYIYIGQNAQKIGGTYQWIDDKRVIDWIFTLDQRPKDIVFPLGRPQPGLYMAHPVKTDQYYPMKGVEETLFMEKVREFCWFVQCLGATRVSFHSNKGLSVSQGMGSTMNAETQIGVKYVNVGGGYGNTRKQDDAYSSNQQVELVQNFTPKKKAYCPDDLIWLDSDPAWQMLLKQRLEGGIMEYTYKISSSETCQMSTNEMESVKANFEYMMVKANGSYDVSTDKTFSSNEETEWSIHVEFAPLEELTEEPYQHQTMKNMDDFEKMDAGMSLTEEQRRDYRTRANDPFSMKIGSVWQLENPPKPMALGRVWSGQINTSEDNRVVILDAQGRRKYAEALGVCMLNEIYYEAEFGDACGIILDKVDIDDLEIGATIYLASEHDRTQSEITEAEQEYLDMVKECLEDGEIGNRERKLLDKIRVKNGISEERAKELESTLTVPQLTDDEKEYLEAFKDACEDGKVSDKQRRLLEKLRVMYGISKERAKLLENI